MVFNKELDFEKALIRVLCTKGWKKNNETTSKFT